jgi:hypothetical protein
LLNIVVLKGATGLQVNLRVNPETAGMSEMVPIAEQIHLLQSLLQKPWSLV